MDWICCSRIIGQARAKVLEPTDAPDVPLMFYEKQSIAVTIRGAILGGGDAAIPHTYCEVYAPLGIKTNVMKL